MVQLMRADNLLQSPQRDVLCGALIQDSVVLNDTDSLPPQSRSLAHEAVLYCFSAAVPRIQYL